ncbi:hypothetical protein AGMMS50268_01790 [Spirochaetia bacterium]|nr:hypothetical protein AGMMS50268_01790 [Spirochaetia bacterium]
MNKPEYTKDEVYKELEKICECAGRKVFYDKEILSGTAAMTDKYAHIRMPEDISGTYDFLDNEQTPSEVLGHEIAHCLIEHDVRLINYFKALLPESEQAMEWDEEGICDYIGIVLHSLAELIAIKSEEQPLK